MNRNGLRKLINNLHLWLGLSSGLILFLVCLSGTVYTFRAEIERWVNKEKYYSAWHSRESLSADSIIATVERSTNGRVTSLVVPGDKELNWQISVKNREQKSSAARPKTFFVDPVDARIAGNQEGGSNDFFTKVMKMHRWLMLDDSTGRIIVGAATLIFVFMILSGLILWFPARLKNMKNGLTIKTTANWKRINHDLHSTLGFYSFLVLLVISVTGLCWSFEWYRDGAGNILGSKVFKGRNEKPLQTSSLETKVSIQKILDAAQGLFNYTGNIRLVIPGSTGSAYVVNKSATGFFAVAGADKAQFDGITAVPLNVERFSDKPLNVKIADSIRPLHTGEMFGTFSKIIYFLVCLVATSLPVTGTIIWINKMKKQKKPLIKSVIQHAESV